MNASNDLPVPSRAPACLLGRRPTVTRIVNKPDWCDRVRWASAQRAASCRS